MWLWVVIVCPCSMLIVFSSMIPQFTFLFLDGHLYSFPFEAVMNLSCAYLLVNICTPICGVYNGNEIAESQSVPMFSIIDMANLFPNYSYQFLLPPAENEDSSCYISSTTLNIVCLFCMPFWYVESGITLQNDYF